MLKSLHIKDYRNIHDIFFEFDKGINIFIGNNGQGKTNILESIYAFSIGKAFRAKNIYEAIPFEKEALHLYATANGNKQEIHAANNPRKQVKYIQSEKKCSYMDFLGNFFSVLFSPSDLEVVRGSPSIRRNYIDSLIIRLDKSYAYDLQHYEKILRQRNALLKKMQENNNAEGQLDVWDEALAKNAQPIWEKRKNTLEIFIKKLKKFYKDLSLKDHDVDIDYITKGSPKTFSEELKERRKKDIIIGSTTAGPHRDDILMYLNKKLVSEFASQGETRSLMLSSTLSEVEMIEEMHGEKVTLLLDDVFSELDLNRQKALINLAKDRQTFITSTHIEDIDLKGKIYKIEKGKALKA